MLKVYTVDEIKNIASKIAERHGVERMFLFGSYARGDAKTDSDLDFRIDKGQIRGLFALGGLYADLEDAFGIHVDLLTTDSLDESFRKEIESEEVLIYGQG
ncbi:nucleotidyltransferase domain-containing protein [Desulfoscipio sp. XC116]|uniref:nucleotidyltransferase family protein n=1 Tax=Desulfoscipio sp. XC116 TaxID=3144975 RepID=UPI00325BBF72